MSDNNFPSTEWQFSIDTQNPVEIVHPSGIKFISVINLNRLDRLGDEAEAVYNLNEKDSFLLSYLIDYFVTKSEHMKLEVNQAMVLSANLFCSYRFRIALDHEIFCNEKTKKRDYRKFGEHWIYLKESSRKIPVFIIGKSEDKKSKYLFAITLTADSLFPQYELVELPRDYFYRNN